MRHLQHILVGVKPGSAASHPLGMASQLASLAHARVTAVSVTDRSSSASWGAPALPHRVTGVRAVGIPAIEIARLADSGNADLVVLGRELPTGIAAREGRDTAEGTVRRARVPCLLVPRGQHSFHRALVAVDGGPDSEPVVTAALLVGMLFEAEVRTLHVAEPVAAGTGVMTSADWLAAGESDTIACQGDPVSEILRVARGDAVDLLVFGHHRGGPVSPDAGSGVAARLLQSAPCAVLAVPL